MKLTQKSEYAFRAMFVLARAAANGKVVRTAEIAKREGIPEKFLEMILVDLRKAGLVGSQRGPEGGHRLARAASQITIGDIWRAIDGPLSPLAGLTPGPPGSALESCLRHVWDEVETAVTGVVDRVTLAEISDRARELSGSPDFSI